MWLFVWILCVSVGNVDYLQLEWCFFLSIEVRMYVALLELLELLEFGECANERGDVDNLRVAFFFGFWHVCDSLCEFCVSVLCVCV